MIDSYLARRGLRAQGKPLGSSFACDTDPTDGPLQEHEPHGLSFVDDLTGMHVFTSPDHIQSEAT
eukprot:5506943-Pyramimonas_sp.AAC.1